MPHTLAAQITYVIFDLICLFALWQGDRAQKLAGVLLLAVNSLTPFVQDRVHWMDPGARFLLMDVILLVFFLWLATRRGRAWMIVAAAFQLLSTLSHPAAHFAAGIGPRAYIIVFQLFSYGVFMTLAVSVGFDLLVSGPKLSKPNHARTTP